MPVQQHMEQAVLADLRPTQMTVGAAEVAVKRSQWAQLAQGARQASAKPLVSRRARPRGRFYIVDHHHLGQALTHEKCRTYG